MSGPDKKLLPSCRLGNTTQLSIESRNPADGAHVEQPTRYAIAQLRNEHVNDHQP